MCGMSPDVTQQESADAGAPRGPLTATEGPAEKPRVESRLQRWGRRAGVLIFVFLCAVIGVLLVILPWHPEWTDNHFLLRYPALRSIFGNNFFRGVCSGLGVLDIWIGFWEAIHYHEEPRR